MAGSVKKKAGHGTKKQKQQEQDQKMFSMGVTESSRVLYQAFCAYVGLLDSPLEQTTQAKAVLREWVEDGSITYGMDQETKSEWDTAIWGIFSSIRESIVRDRAEGNQPAPRKSSIKGLILPPEIER